ncbi:hypothetical protein GIB67_002634 [Kingdonia uniflora]|uniref:rRNA methyltransferase n=1 Tax=Kingdonia uniflora TaxID=39325 RepID=A0A7J7N4H7_9MAGN|nr:hypothetical protein GIB67_002634 [Kingdonia uniflora]
MGKAKTKGKDRTEDKYYKLAKQAGYRARSSFKLIHIDDKYNFLNSSRSILDLCAAPGGWMQIAVKRAPVGAFVLGVDLNPITKMLGAISIQEDITTPKCRATIKRLMQENGCRAFDLVLHDGSPNIGGRWAQEATEQNALVIEALRLATQFLAPKGDFITKIFRSQDYTAVIYCLSQLFGKVEPLKPDSSRKESAETFLIAKHYRAPAKVDPKLLDIKHLFQGGTETLKVVDVLREKKQKRHRDGYEDGVSTLRKVYSASKFVWSESPLDVLGSVTFISFDDPDSLSVKDHILTTEEVKALCDDLGVLGKQDFKHLLKWRMNIRKALSPAKQVVTENDGSKDEDKEDKDEDDDKVLNEMEELTYAMDRKKKREKQRIQKRLVKDKSRKATGMQIDALGDEYVDHELFSLAAIKGKKDLEAVDSTEVNDEKANMGYSSDEDTRETGFRQESSSDIDSDEEARRYDEQLEGFLDEAYERFINKRDGSSKQRKRAKRSFSEANKELMEVQ